MKIFTLHSSLFTKLALFTLFSLFIPMSASAQSGYIENPQSVVNLTNRVLGADASSHFTFVLDETFNGGAEAFRMDGTEGNVTITANTLSAMTAGLNWYLNHEAHVNIAWNNLCQTVTVFPAPTDKTIHSADGKYRYYLNYCTFSYSMAFYDWNRWQKEIDWMALHGVNLPLQIVGIDAVWYQMLTSPTSEGGYGWTHDKANTFIAGPAFQGWFLMNNLTNTGGPNPVWWYKREAALGRKIVERMVELGMKPCLPGFVGMAPNELASASATGYTPYTGSWNGITSPAILNANATDAFNTIAEKYYKYIYKVYGYWPESYSMDPFHERSLPSGVNESVYKQICDNARYAMNTYGGCSDALWVAQEWQSNADQSRINALVGTNSLLLDLSSERVTTYQSRYKNIPYLFCLLNNYGGNIGMHGMMDNMLRHYAQYKSNSGDGTHGILSGVGCTPEGIDNNTMMYDLLFELPWMKAVPGNSDAAQSWLNDYTRARYGISSTDAQTAWDNLRTTVFAATNSNQQGCREPVFCANPNLSGNDASGWAHATYYWDKQKVIEAARLLLNVASASGEVPNTANYNYDVVDFLRQALTDYAHTLQMDMAKQSYTGERFGCQAEGFLSLMDDIDTLLGTIEDFRMGHWAGAARALVDEPALSGDYIPSNASVGSFASAADWLEWNARALVTTWTGANDPGGLTDYANREYQGMISDYYRPRMKYYFEQLQAGNTLSDSHNHYYNIIEAPFREGQTTAYTSAPYGCYTPNNAIGDPVATSQALYDKYFAGRLSDGTRYLPYVTTSATSINITLADKSQADVLTTISSVFAQMTAGSAIKSYCFDMDENGVFDGETIYTDGTLPTCPNVDMRMCITTTDGAEIIVTASIGSGEAPTTVVAGDWTFSCRNTGLNLTLTGIVSGSGDCVIPETYTYADNTFRIVALADGFMANNKDVTSLSIPSSITNLGTAVRTKDVTEVTTNGNKKHFHIPETLSRDGQWSIEVKMNIGQTGFNQWGVACFGLGYAIADPTGTINGFQFYQNTAGNSSGELHIMPEHGGVRYVTDDVTGSRINLLNCIANIRLDYNNGLWCVNVLADNGAATTLSYTSKPSVDINYLNFISASDSEILSVTYQIGSEASDELIEQDIQGLTGTTQTITLPVTLRHNENWCLSVALNYNGTAYNQWGSSLLTVGSDAFNWSNAFQLYIQKADSKIKCSYTPSASQIISLPVSSTKLTTVIINHMASGTTHFEVCTDGKTEGFDVNSVYDDITLLSTAMSTGSSFHLTVSGDAVDNLLNSMTFLPGCENMTAISVDDANPTFASADGALYNKSMSHLLRVPEGRTTTVHAPQQLTAIAAHALDNCNALININLAQWGLIRGLDLKQTSILVSPTATDNQTRMTRVSGIVFPEICMQHSAADAWQMVVLPFNVSSSEIATTFGAVKLPKAISRQPEGTLVLSLSDAEDIAAGVPYFVQTTGTETAFANKAFQKTTTQSLTFSTTDKLSYLTFDGTYDAKSLSVGSYLLETGELIRQTTTKQLTALSAYATLSSTDTSLDSNTITIDDELLVNINTLTANTTHTHKVYDLQGRRTSTPTKGGVYIQGNRKLVF